MKLISFPRQLL